MTTTPEAGSPWLITPNPRDLLVPGKGTVLNRGAEVTREAEREVVRLDARPGEGLVWWEEPTLDGSSFELSFSVRGKNELQKSFVGVAFHGERVGDTLTHEAVYFRPFNFVAEDPVRRRHMVQYVCHPEYPWPTLREERPDQFEAGVHPIPDPDDWFAARVVVSDTTVKVYVQGSPAPSLEVTRLRARRGGWVGYWVGHGSDGAFADLTLRLADNG